MNVNCFPPSLPRACNVPRKQIHQEPTLCQGLPPASAASLSFLPSVPGCPSFRLHWTQDQPGIISMSFEVMLYKCKLILPRADGLPFHLFLACFRLKECRKQGSQPARGHGTQKKFTSKGARQGGTGIGCGALACSCQILLRVTAVWLPNPAPSWPQQRSPEPETSSEFLRAEPPGVCWPLT